MNVLVADDEQEIADLIEIYLTNEHYKVYKYYDSANILKDLPKLNIDLAILDVMMPGTDGFSLCHQIRKVYKFPIIFVTAKIGDTDKINGLTIGADDYITKPFQPIELVARVKAQLRRYKEYNNIDNNENVISIKALTINKSTHECQLGSEKLDLTPIEFNILWYLCTKADTVVTTDELFKAIWQEQYYDKDNNTIMVHIRHLREKMHDSTKDAKYIKTIWGVGYKIEK